MAFVVLKSCHVSLVKGFNCTTHKYICSIGRSVSQLKMNIGTFTYRKCNKTQNLNNGEVMARKHGGEGCQASSSISGLSTQSNRGFLVG